MRELKIHLSFNGNCEEAFEYYKNIFGGEFTYLGRLGDMPKQEDMPEVQEADKNKLMHISLQINEKIELMGNDVWGTDATNFLHGNHFTASIHVDTHDEADSLFKGLSEKGKITMPMAETFWDSYFGLLTDKFGITWMISADSPQK